MATNRYGVDLASVIGAGESIKGARAQNRLAQLKIKSIEGEGARQNQLAQLRQEAVGSDEAKKRLLVMDPVGGEQFIQSLANMDKRSKAEAKENIEQIGKMSSYVLQGKTPEEQSRRYDVIRQSAPAEVQATMPEQFDPSYVELSLSKAMTMDQILSDPKVVRVGEEDILFKGGREQERAARPKPATGAGKGADFSLKSSGENAMYRQAVELLGGVFDAAGNITALDPSVRPKVQAIANEATKIYTNAKGSKTRTQAVTEAAQKFQVDIPGPPMPDPTDPASIRQYLLQQ